MSSSTSTPGADASAQASSGRGPLALILSAIGILAIIAGILYVSGAANSMHFMVGNVHYGVHQIRAIVAFAVGLACLIGAYLARGRSGSGSGSGAAD